MAQPLVYVDTSEVHEGALKELKGAIEELVEFIEANEPQILAYQVYLSESGDRTTVMHVHANPASFDYHMDVAGPAFKKFASLLTQRSIRVYGEPSDQALRQVHEKAQLLGCEDVAVHRLHSGFSRMVPG